MEIETSICEGIKKPNSLAFSQQLSSKGHNTSKDLTPA
jgi:hypothetical protein